MNQSRRASLIEASVNTIAGYGISALLCLAVLPMFGLHPTLVQNLKIGVVFTLASLTRNYLIRRLFDRRGLMAGHTRPGRIDRS